MLRVDFYIKNLPWEEKFLWVEFSMGHVTVGDLT